LAPYWAKDLKVGVANINAKAEGIENRPAFREAFQRRRWVVERTFSWFGRNRRLAKDFENLAETLATFVTLASIQLALGRLARA
jgi:transposase